MHYCGINKDLNYSIDTFSRLLSLLKNGRDGYRREDDPTQCAHSGKSSKARKERKATVKPTDCLSRIKAVRMRRRVAQRDAQGSKLKTTASKLIH
jgi:hypothetical protein